MTGRTLFRWFESAALRHADEPALEVDGLVVCYDELHRTALALAARIAAECGGVPDRIGLLASRSLAAYAGYLAIQRLGATAVPLGPDYPAVRNAETVRRAGVRAVLVEEGCGAALPDGPMVLVTVPPFGLPSEPPGPGVLPPVPTDTDRMAYLIFTSGSTGRPKGVPVRHRNVDPMLAYNTARFGTGPGSRVSQVYGLTFDVSVFNMFLAWGAGATLVVPSPAELQRLVDFIVDRGITHWNSVPSVVTMAQLMGTLPLGRATALRHSIFGAEPVTVQHVDLWRQVAPNSEIHNLYGPTETTVNCSDYLLPADRSQWAASSNGTVPIGRVYPHLEAILLDEDGLPADDGELCVRGPQRFDGYLDPADDEGRFLAFEPGVGPAVLYDGGGLTDRHWYRTGDRVRHENGLLVHRGRLDNQVKILGHRVEIGEVEAALRERPGVVEAAVVAAPVNGVTRLLAAYSGSAMPSAEFSHWLRARLPLYMVPLRIRHMEALPLNDNGKIDRRRLAELLA
ncbi:amino acid adenylation domain-containing protein [Kitasatospora sp. MAA4]|uniref:AMP-binding protein n=1 Tax=Kitasatospora sp. MAA4 TaxID=3035093 RepID=UPI002475C4F2|nr:AMP-binding protein [Kitasatospora sp. MAA4]MDH6136205.1 amino acid adenylation domain-containing protein [Kitasatospora sp. MAA4]